MFCQLTINIKEYKSFEEIKHRDEDGTEYWFARELAPVLDYARWENFSKVIDRAMLACRNSGYEITDQFVEINKLIEMPAGFRDVTKTHAKPIKDYRLSRYAC